MNKRKIFILSFVLGLIVLIGVGFWNLPAMKEQRRLEQIKNDRAAEMQKTNSESYKNLIAAIEQGKELASKKPNDFYVWAELGSNYQALSDYKNAENSYKKALLINEKSPLVLNNLAKLKERLGKKEEAIEFYKKIIEYFPEEPVTYEELALLYEALGRKDEAIYIRGQWKLRSNIENPKNENLLVP